MISVTESKTVVTTHVDTHRVTPSVEYVVVTAGAVVGPPGAPGRDADIPISNTYVLAGDGLTGGGPLSGNVTVSVDDTVVRANGVMYIDYANSRVGINQSDPRIDLQIGEVGIGTYTASTTSTMPNQIIDSWDASYFRSAKYHIQMHSVSANSHEISEVFLVHSGGDVYYTEYAVISTGPRLAQYSATMSGNTVRLLCSPSFAINTITVHRTVVRG